MLRAAEVAFGYALRRPVLRGVSMEVPANGFVGILGPDGPLGYSTNVRIVEHDDPNGRPQRISISGRSASLDVSAQFDVTSAVTTRSQQGPLANRIDFLQLRGDYTVTGTAGDRTLQFTAPGAAETFRGK